MPAQAPTLSEILAQVAAADAKKAQAQAQVKVQDANQLKLSNALAQAQAANHPINTGYTVPAPAPTPVPAPATPPQAAPQVAPQVQAQAPAPVAPPLSTSPYPVAPQTMDFASVLKVARDAMGQQNLQGILGQRQQMSISDILGVSDPAQLWGLSPEEVTSLVATRGNLAAQRTNQAAAELALTKELSGVGDDQALVKSLYPAYANQQAQAQQEQFQQANINARQQVELAAKAKEGLSPSDRLTMRKLAALDKQAAGKPLNAAEKNLLGEDTMSVNTANKIVHNAQLAKASEEGSFLRSLYASDLAQEAQAQQIINESLPVKAPGEAKPTQGGTRQAPVKGDIVNGFRFKGGNPKDKNSWEKK